MILSEEVIRAEAARLNQEARSLEQAMGLAETEQRRMRDQARSYAAQFEALRVLLRELHHKDFGQTGAFPFDSTSHFEAKP